MRKIISGILVFALVFAMLCTAVSAAGMNNIKQEITLSDGGTLTFEGRDVDGNPTTGDADSIHVEYIPPAGTPDSTLYLVFAQDKEGAPTQGTNIVYIDQQQTTNGKVAFDVYAGDLMKEDTPYYICMSSNAQDGITSFQKVISFMYSQGEIVALQLGDFDGNGKIETNDALQILRTLVGFANAPTEAAKTAGDVDCNGELTTNDALQILRFLVNFITSFDEIKVNQQ